MHASLYICMYDLHMFVYVFPCDTFLSKSVVVITCALSSRPPNFHSLCLNVLPIKFWYDSLSLSVHISRLLSNCSSVYPSMYMHIYLMDLRIHLSLYSSVSDCMPVHKSAVCLSPYSRLIHNEILPNGNYKCVRRCVCVTPVNL